MLEFSYPLTFSTMVRRGTLMMVTSSSSLHPAQLLAGSKLNALYWPNLEKSTW